MYLPARMFCTLAVLLLFPWVQKISTCKNIFYTCWYDLYPCLWCIYLQECFVHSPYFFYSHGFSKFLHARTFLHSLIRLLYPCLRCIYLQERTTFIPMFEMYLPAMQERSVTCCTSSIPMGAVHARTFFRLADTTFIPMFAMYLPARMFCTLTLLLQFRWVQ